MERAAQRYLATMQRDLEAALESLLDSENFLTSTFGNNDKAKTEFLHHNKIVNLHKAMRQIIQDMEELMERIDDKFTVKRI